MDLFKMMGQMKEMKKAVEETKEKLNTITVVGEAYEGEIKVSANGNRKITNVEIAENLLGDKEKLEDMLKIATNRAIENADKVFEAEMQSATKGFMPNIPGLS